MKKLISKLIINLLFIFALPAGIFATPENGSEPAFVILHTNDVHGYYENTDYVIGHDVLAAYRDSLSAPTILISAGDMIQGIYFVNQNRGEAAVDIMNTVGYEAMSVGNHEFDYGLDRLNELAGKAKFPFLSQVDGMEHSMILNVSGHKVGIFGITTPYTKYSSIGALNMDFGTSDDIAAYAKDMVQTLKNKGAEFIIALSHLGTDDNSSLGVDYGTSYGLRSIDGIDLIIDGHSHTSLDDIIQDGKTLIVSTGWGMAAFGQVEVGKNLEIIGYRSITKEDTSNVKPDPAVTAVIDEWVDKVAKAGAEVVSYTDTAISVERINERTKETVMGNLVADAMRWAADTDIAFENGGDIRASFDVGDITVGEVNATLPFSNYLCKTRLKGSVIKEALEVSVSSYPETRGGFLQVSGLTFEFDPAKAAGRRIVSVSVGGKPLDPDKEYTVVTNDFISAGGDEYVMFKEPFLTAPLTIDSGISAVADAVTEYLNSGAAKIGLEGRIKIYVELPPLSKKSTVKLTPLTDEELIEIFDNSELTAGRYTAKIDVDNENGVIENIVLKYDEKTLFDGAAKLISSIGNDMYIYADGKLNFYGDDGSASTLFTFADSYNCLIVAEIDGERYAVVIDGADRSLYIYNLTDGTIATGDVRDYSIGYSPVCKNTAPSYLQKNGDYFVFYTVFDINTNEQLNSSLIFKQDGDRLTVFTPDVLSFTNVNPGGEKLWLFEYNGKWIYMDSGEQLVAQFDDATAFTPDGVAFVRNGEHGYFVDTKLNRVSEPLNYYRGGYVYDDIFELAVDPKFTRYEYYRVTLETAEGTGPAYIIFAVIVLILAGAAAAVIMKRKGKKNGH
jgi:5'-nucleotidase